MPAGLRGSLLSHAYAQDRLTLDFAGRIGESTRQPARQAFRRAWHRAATAIGPASGVLAVLDLAVAPCLSILGFELHDVRRRERGFCTARIERRGNVVAALLVTPWGDSLDGVRRDATRHAADSSAAWAIVSDGQLVRLLDPGRSYARSHLEFDLSQAIEDEHSFDTLWAVLRAEAISVTGEGGRSILHEILAASERHSVGVCRSLREGVLEALCALLNGAVARHTERRRPTAAGSIVSVLHEQCLTLVYRVLFLLFAEARALVPTWHPLFRDGYSVETLRTLAEDPLHPPGLWDGLQAICRLAHRGCRAGDLIVTPFNGRLFAPERTATADRSGVADEVVREAIVALSSRPDGTSGRRRVSYGDLGVEQLGAVYESVLDYRPAFSDAAPASAQSAKPRLLLRAGSGRRKATGSFYTPRSITEYLVRRTLSPLITGRSAADILNLRVLDPAMGSGAFLVACCRHLAGAYEAALVAEGRCSTRDLDDGARAEFRRLVAQRCLYGVDLNPMAVQLACLSLWLATLAAGRPLTFLDHHLQVGDSLVGASLADLARQPPGTSRGGRAPARLPLFETSGVESVLRDTLPQRLRLALDPDDTADAVRAKERLLARLSEPDANLSRWKRLADLWCSGWFWTGPEAAPPPRSFGDLADWVLRGRSAFPSAACEAWCRRAEEIAGDRRFFHWSLEFPEVFFEASGQPRAAGGFDAVLGNPPWDMLRADDPAASHPVRQLGGFIRSAGIFRGRASGHVNLYQLFVERSLSLLRPDGRLGLVVPSGLATDHGSRELRRWLLERCDTDSILGFDNRTGIFPIHRGLRFLLLTSTKGRTTTTIACRFGETDPVELDRIPDASIQPDAAFPVLLTRRFIERFSRDDCVIPDLRSPLDLQIVEKIVSTVPTLDDPRCWGLRFGRELNATDDRPHFSAGGDGLPILEGKHLGPFTAEVRASRWSIRPSVADRLVDPARTYMRDRLAYRDVASATNQLTLIATILPRGVLTIHTVFCLTTALNRSAQRFLCGMLNSYVANYLVRLRVSTHVTTAIVEQLSVPEIDPQSPDFSRIVAFTDRLLESGGTDERAHAQLQGTVGTMYGLTRDEFSHVLDTFPLVAAERRAAALEEFGG